MLRRPTRARRIAPPDPPEVRLGGAGDPGDPGDQRERAAAALRLHLLPTAEASDGRAAWRVAEGLAAALVRATDEGELSVHPDELVTWGLGREEAFHLASANVRAGPVPAVAQHRPAGAAELLLISGPGPATATHALWLDDLVGQLPPSGALVAVPHRRAVLAHRLERRDHAVEAVNLLLLMADAAWRQGPDRVSAGLYWWRDGSFTELGGHVDGEVVHVDPPAAFLEALEALSHR